MQRRKERHLGTLQEGLPKIVEMEMNDVEHFCTTRDRLQHRYIRTDMVMRRLILVAKADGQPAANLAFI
jgi:hypothetical protein